MAGISSVNNSPLLSVAASLRPQRDETADIARLRSADSEVRAKLQQAAARAGDGVVTPQVTYSIGPDGQRYATGGTVSISRVIKGPRPFGGLDQAESARDVSSDPIAVNDNNPNGRRFRSPSLADFLPPQVNLSPVEFAQIFGQDIAENTALFRLRASDSGVRGHEAQHYRAAGGLVTGLPQYSYATGPDGQSYAIGGSVGVKTTSTSDPAKAQRDSNAYYNAAVAPGDASGADLKAARGALSRAAEAYGRLQSAQNQVDFAA